jgi:hypothetical protein
MILSSLNRNEKFEIAPGGDRPLEGWAQTQQILTALGYQHGDSVYLRTLPPKGFDPENYQAFPELTYRNKQKVFLPASKKLRLEIGADRLYWMTKTGERFLGNAWKFLRSENAKGFGIYFIPNPGGQSDNEIQSSKLIFWEDDKRSKEEQLARFDAQQAIWGGGIAIETKSSIHSYIRHDELLSPAASRIAQKRVIEAFDSDASIWNPSRLMRLPGFDHTKIEDGAIVRFPVTIVRRWDGSIASWEAINKALPEIPEEKQKEILRGQSDRPEHTPIPVSDHPGDPRNWAQSLPHYVDKGNGWASAAIPAPGVTSNNGFQIRLEDGAINIFSGTVDRWEAIQAALEYANALDPQTTLAAYSEWLSENQDENYQPGHFSVLPGGKADSDGDEDPTPAQLRDRQNAKRMMQALSLMPIINRDYKISDEKLVEYSDVIEYDGAIPGLEEGSLSGSDRLTIALQGALGAGKTEWIIKHLIPLAKHEQVILAAPRNSLLFDTIGRILKANPDLEKSIYHYQSDVSLHRDLLRTGQPGLYVMCPDSFKTYSTGGISPEKLCNAILICDEFRSIRKALPQKGRDCFDEFKRLVEHCRVVIVADAHLSDIDLKRLEQCDREKTTTRIYRQNAAKYQKEVIFLETRNKEGAISNSHQGVGIEMAFKLAAENKAKGSRLAIFSDCKETGYILKSKLTAAGYRVCFVCRDSPEDNREILAAPNETLKNEDVFIYSPTAESGLNIDKLRFDDVLLLSHGILEPLTLLQGAGRCRQAKRIFISSPRRANNTPLAMSEKSLFKMLQKFKEGMKGLGFGKSKTGLISWSFTEQELGKIYKIYCREILEIVCREMFSSVEIQEMKHDRWAEHSAARVEHKLTEMGWIMDADPDRGAEIRDSKAAPSTRADVFAVRLSRLLEERKSLIEPFRAKYLELRDRGEDTEEILLTLIEISKGRLDRLRGLYLALHGEDRDIAMFLEYLKSQEKLNLWGRNIALYRSIILMRRLRLQDLILLHQKSGKVGQGAIQHENIFNERSPQIRERFQAFCKDEELINWFSNIDTPYQFFALINSTLLQMGIEGTSEQQRDSLKRGASNRAMFRGWVRLEFSGNKCFRELLPRIWKAIREWVKRILQDFWDGWIANLSVDGAEHRAFSGFERYEPLGGDAGGLEGGRCDGEAAA